MNGIAQRISDRISTAFAAVKCPGCRRYVVPTTGPATTPEAAAPAPAGKRWSFIWLPPRGEVCPACSFPLSRYAGRRKWVRLFLAGVVLLVSSFLFSLSAGMSGLGGSMWGPLECALTAEAFPGCLGWLGRLTAGVGLVAFLGGLVGIIVGGRHGPMRAQRTDIHRSTHGR